MSITTHVKNKDGETNIIVRKDSTDFVVMKIETTNGVIVAGKIFDAYNEEGLAEKIFSNKLGKKITSNTVRKKLMSLSKELFEKNAEKAPE